MWRYLTAAFWARAHLPGLGPLPLNAVLCAGAACLGFFVPGVWLVGLGVETAWLFALATNRRFQRTVDAADLERSRGAGADDRAATRRSLEASLPPEAAKRLRALTARCERVLTLKRASQGDGFSADSEHEALERLTWAYLKLLLAQANLTQLSAAGGDGRLRQQTEALAAELAAGGLTEAMQQSKQATLAILRKRLDNLARREQLLAEVASDLERVDAQVDLAVENAAMPAGTGQVSLDLDLAGHLLDSSLYGSSEAAVSALDQRYARPAAATA